MKKICFSLLFVIPFFTFNSCSNNENIDFKEESNNPNFIKREVGQLEKQEQVLDYFKENFRFGKEFLLEEYNANMIEIIIENTLVGYYIDNKDFNSIGVVDIRDIDFIKYVNVSKINEIFSFALIFNNDYDTIVPDFNVDYFTALNRGDDRCQGNLMLCTGTCTLGALGIAASDGPLPFADALAVSFWVGCNAHCVSSFDLCMNPPKYN
uniref:hypothetical protein n=1 Tax=Gelidibacter sp. TaxID=2018083 RepID=UPI004049E868